MTRLKNKGRENIIINEWLRNIVLYLITTRTGARAGTRIGGSRVGTAGLQDASLPQPHLPLLTSPALSNSARRHRPPSSTRSSRAPRRDALHEDYRNRCQRKLERRRRRAGSSGEEVWNLGRGEGEGRPRRHGFFVWNCCDRAAAAWSRALIKRINQRRW